MKERDIPQVINEEWTLTEPASIYQIQRVYSTIYILEAPDYKYALKCTSVNSPERQGVINDVMHIARNEYRLPVPEIVRTASGKSFISRDDYTATLTKFIEGTEYSTSEIQLQNAAILLAKFHKFFENKPHHALLEEDVYPNDIDFLKSLIPQKDREVENVIKITLDSHGKIPEKFDIPRQVGHFDFNASNLKFKKDDVNGLLDFDLIRISERARDVALAMYKLNRGMQQPRRHQIFLNAYESINPLLPEEKDILPELFFEETRRKITYILKKMFTEEMPIKEELLSQLAQVQEIYDNKE